MRRTTKALLATGVCVLSAYTAMGRSVAIFLNQLIEEADAIVIASARQTPQEVCIAQFQSFYRDVSGVEFAWERLDLSITNDLNRLWKDMWEYQKDPNSSAAWILSETLNLYFVTVDQTVVVSQVLKGHTGGTNLVVGQMVPYMMTKSGEPESCCELLTTNGDYILFLKQKEDKYWIDFYSQPTLVTNSYEFNDLFATNIHATFTHQQLLERIQLQVESEGAKTVQ